ncbi:helix-turn-helix transcriptional regulator [Psychrobacillus sp. FSL H8-0483]|uniref:helix-turn-helix domain-containing protein n=1 Tax=Psychrobacillus sp. FSL H8-0483 TaxID=2921389 RepID=UPI00315B2C30
MAFYEHIRAYREQLEITQMEAAKSLGIDHSVLSKYERGDLAIPIDLLMKFVEVYAIPQDLFFNMLKDIPFKSKNPGLEARESRTRYIESFQEEYVSQVVHLKEYRDFTMQVVSTSTDDKERKRFITNIMKKD